MRAKDGLEQDLIQLTQADTRSQIEMVAKRIAGSVEKMITEAIETTCAKQKPYDGDIEGGI